MGGSFEISKVKMQVFDVYTHKKKGKTHPPEYIPDKKKTLKTYTMDMGGRNTLQKTVYDFKIAQ